MVKRKAKPSKLAKEDLQSLIEEALEKGTLLYRHHARERQKDRQIIDFSVEQILVQRKNYKPSRDRFDEGLDTWSYCYDGIDLDQKNIRVIVAIEPKQRVVVVTVVDLKKDSNL